jgi:glycerol-3-phosphate dehydrogenase
MATIEDYQFERESALAGLQTEPFDLLVIGGGITGAGVALDAASRGLKVALIERNDFASGTSSRSSKLVHGGLRYLQHGDVSLVYEALYERQRLLRNAPHLVKPLPFVIPIFTSKRAALAKSANAAISSALWMYDITGGVRIGKFHSRLSSDAIHSYLPSLNADRISSGFVYYDASADDARLTLEVLETAVLRYGAIAANYTEAVGLSRDTSGNITSVTVRSRIFGDNGSSNHAPASAEAAPTAVPAQASTPAAYSKQRNDQIEFEIRAKVVINATGAWVDTIQSLDSDHRWHTVRPAKGVHLSFNLSKLPLKAAGVLPVRSDRRNIFIIPWDDAPYAYVGTTDTDWDGSIDDPQCTPDDINYLLDAVNHYLDAPLSVTDVTAVWAGVRPLLDKGNHDHRQARTADLSRHHSVVDSGSGLITITGGKLTTYRKMARDTVDKAIAHLHRTGAGVERSHTKNIRIVGSEDRLALQELRQAAAQTQFGLPPATATHLIGRYGTNMPALIDLAAGYPGSLEPIVPQMPYLVIEAIWAAQKEMACTVEDILARRMRMSFMDAAAARQAASALSSTLAEAWNRDTADVQRDVELFTRSLDNQNISL